MALVSTVGLAGAAPSPLLYHNFEEGAGLGDGSTISNKAPGGSSPTPDGEVEDYAIAIEDAPSPGEPKWIQRPDLSEQGMDVRATEPFILADDFGCTVTEPITNVVVWGSWYYDETPFGSESNLEFTLSFHADIPTNELQRFSMPGEPLWSQRFTNGMFKVDVERRELQEGWYDPRTGVYDPNGDTICFRYTFPAVETNRFVQQGTTNDPVVYWLDVQAHPRGGTDAIFGWKTADTNWNDDAVWGEGREPHPGPWNELRYPDEHPRRGESIDLAFALYGGEEEEELLDWGDAPDGPYPTFAASTGAWHVIGGPWLGDATDGPDPEFDGQPDPNALGDDIIDGNDDEDGVVIPTLVQGQTANIMVTVNSVNGLGGGVDVWIDYDGDGMWSPAENVFGGSLPNGTHPIAVTPPMGSVIGPTFARFRISTVGGLRPIGGAQDGEVEDHEVIIDPGFEPKPSKWVQGPDLSREGMDVYATAPLILADDFECKYEGAITNIVVWGSWYKDRLPPQGPGNVTFVLSIHSDVPTNDVQSFSVPGDVLWFTTFTSGTFTVGIEAEDLREGWYDPARDWYTNAGDTICFRYEFPIAMSNAFIQTGTTNNPEVYWLDVQASTVGGDTFNFGWKSSPDHWNDDAVWGLGSEPHSGPWNEMRYPTNHVLHGQSVDLAFALYTGETEPDPEYDWGDAPDGPYPTFATSTGAWHVIGGPWLGDATDGPDPEFDGQPDPNALGDDIIDGNDDEDGVVIPTLVQGQTANIMVTVNSVNGLGGGVDVWIDYDGDGVWSPAEKVFGGSLPNGTHPIAVTPPTGSVIGPTFARFRISSAGGLSPIGGAPDGEVEDHEVIIDPGFEPEPSKWVQGPDLSREGMDVYATAPLILADDFECKYEGAITNIVVWGSWYKDRLPPQGPGNVTFVLSIHSDVPTNDVQSFSVPGDVLWFTTFTSGTFTVGIEAEDLREGWYDPARDWYTNAGDTICFRYEFPIAMSNAFIQTGTTNNPEVYWLDVQASTVGGDTFNFGWKSSPDHWNDDAVWGLGSEPHSGPWNEMRYPTNHVLHGESVDLAFALYTGEYKPPPTYDWGDAPDGPYPTYAASTGANHVISGPFMGATVDVDLDGQPSPFADGDDTNGFPDDEDGIRFPGPLVRGNTATVLVDMVYSPAGAMINAWIDFDGDGTWSMGTVEHILSDVGVVAGVTNTLTFPVPWRARMGQAYARFRCDTAGGLSPIGGAADGEVEDYVVDIYQPDPGTIRFTNIVWQVGDTVKVDWVSVNNIEYHLESSTNLLTVTNTGWTYEKTVTGPVNSALMPIGTNMLFKAKFYRLRAPNTP